MRLRFILIMLVILQGKNCFGLNNSNQNSIDPFDAHLITNGDFEQPFQIGWQQTASGGYETFARLTDLDPDPDYEAMVMRIEQSGYANLYQVFQIQTTDLVFSVDAKFEVLAFHSAWTAASISIEYLNYNDSVLGLTRICRKTANCHWSDTTYMHLIEAVDENWHHYSFNIDSELVNIPGVNPPDIDKIRICLFDTIRYC
jgi:hypothetical protein